MLAGSPQDGFVAASLEGSDSVGEETEETSPRICTWLLQPELQTAQAPRKCAWGELRESSCGCKQQTQTAPGSNSPLLPGTRCTTQEMWKQSPCFEIHARQLGAEDYLPVNKILLKSLGLQ